MAIVFESTIKNDGLGGWYIVLKDTTDNRVEICKDIKEYEEKLTKLSEDYGGEIDEVKWFKDDDVSEQSLNEIRMQMHQIQEKYGVSYD